MVFPSNSLHFLVAFSSRHDYTPRFEPKGPRRPNGRLGPNLCLPPRPRLTLRITVPKREVSNSVTDDPKNDNGRASDTGKGKGTHTLARIGGIFLPG